jgi:lipoyl-dependent peroxiredoxin
MDRGAIAVWTATGAHAGTLTTDSGALLNVPFSPAARFELEARPSATTPEELIGAAYAGCFAMTFADRLAQADHPANALRVEARVQLVRPSGYWEIPSIRLHCSAEVPGIADDEFLAIAHAARRHSPIARAMRADVVLTVSLEGGPRREWGVPLHTA